MWLRLQRWMAIGAIGSVLSAAGQGFAADKLSPAQAANQIDQTLLQETAKSSTQPAAARVSDEGFIRRVSLDLVGRVPSADEVTLFVLDGSADKRARLVKDLLASEE